MEDDPVMRMYEAQAIAVEQQLEINKLKNENEELLEELRKLKLVWAVMNKLQKEMRESGDNSARLQQENEGKCNKLLDGNLLSVEARMEAIKRQITDGNDLLARSLLEMNEFKEETRGYFQMAQSFQGKMRKDLTEQIKSNTDNVHSLQLQITKDSSKVHQMQERPIDLEKRLDSMARTMDSISQHMKLKTILIMGGVDENDYARRTMTVLSADRSVWIELQLELPYALFGSGAVFLHNELYVVGGDNNMKALYKLDKNLEWKQLADMNVERRFITNSCLEANGYIWVFGGRDGDRNDLKSVERYDPKEDKWTLMPEMSTVRLNAAAVFWKDRIIVCGGWSEEQRVTSSGECFLLEIGEWTQFPPLPDRLGDHSLISYENKLILTGGRNNNSESLKSVMEMNPLQPNDGWKSLPSKKYACAHFRGLVLDQEIYALGGRGNDNPVLDRVEIFDGKSWRDGPSLPYQRHVHSAVVIPQSLADRLCQYKP